jgi:biopolymer transport protein ExbD
MLQPWRKPAKLFGDFNTLQFASVMAMVVFVILLVFMTIPTHHGGVAVDLPKVLHPVTMRGADREDALKISITRDGKVFFATEQVVVTDLPAKISDRLKDKSVERKVYIVALGIDQAGSRKRTRRGHPARGIPGRSAPF